MKHILLVILLALFNISLYSQSAKPSSVDIFSNPPNSNPVIFGPDVISIKDRYEYGVAISPDQKELFFSAEEPGDGLMVMTKKNDGTWSLPQYAYLRGKEYHDYEAFFSSNGQRLFFTSDENSTSHLWYSEKENGKWGVPKELESPINKDPVFWGTLSNNNTIYYTNLRARKIYLSKESSSKYDSIEDIGLPFGVHPFIAKDESFILYNGKGDLYISYKAKNKKWSEGIMLKSPINTNEYNETCPSLSPDYKYLFFSRYNDTNNKSDIYWVSTENIEGIRK